MGDLAQASSWIEEFSLAGLGAEGSFVLGRISFQQSARVLGVLFSHRRGSDPGSLGAGVDTFARRRSTRLQCPWSSRRSITPSAQDFLQGSARKIDGWQKSSWRGPPRLSCAWTRRTSRASADTTTPGRARGAPRRRRRARPRRGPCSRGTVFPFSFGMGSCAFPVTSEGVLNIMGARPRLEKELVSRSRRCQTSRAG